jgi:phosphate transport system protein
MTRHFQRELDQLLRDVLVMGGRAEAAVADAVRAFMERDWAVADAVIEGDQEINMMELRIEEEVLKILSLYGPTAKDLRFTVGAFKITNDLERVGDLAVNIAERAKAREGEGRGLDELDAMASRVRPMLHRALDAFVLQDKKAAEEVLSMDDPIDGLLKEIFRHQEDFIASGAGEFREAIRFLSTAKYLERIADHATNIAEDVIYMISGEVRKHRH